MRFSKAAVALAGLAVVGLFMLIVAPLEKARYGELSNAEKFLLGGVVAAVLLGVPFFLNEYRLFQLSLLPVFALVVLGLNILTGYAGQISLGHGAFVLIGAYTTALLRNGICQGVFLSFPAGILLGGCASAFVGVIVGVPSLRLQGPYLALVSMGLSVSTPILVRANFLSDYTRGIQGIFVEKPLPPDWVAWLLLPEEWRYFIVLLPSSLLLWLGSNFLRGRIGRALMAMRDSEIGAQAAGISLRKFKLTAFGLSSFFAGIGGGLLIMIGGFVNPDSYTLLDSINFLTATVIGGLGSVLGSILGGAFLAYQSDVNSLLASLVPRGEDLRWALYGALVIVVVTWFPTGLAGRIRR